MQDDIMKYENTLPEDFNGVFEFTNWSDEDFTGIWGKKAYTFAAHTTSPMVIQEHSPIEIQHIRKKFAKDLAEREYFKSPYYEAMRLREGVRDELGMIQPRGQGMSHAGQYSIETLAPYIQKALQPLDRANARISRVTTANVEQNLSKNEDGELNTAAIKSDKDIESLAKGKTLEQKAGIT